MRGLACCRFRARQFQRAVGPLKQGQVTTSTVAAANNGGCEPPQPKSSSIINYMCPTKWWGFLRSPARVNNRSTNGRIPRAKTVGYGAGIAASTDRKIGLLLSPHGTGQGRGCRDLSLQGRLPCTGRDRLHRGLCRSGPFCADIHPCRRHDTPRLSRGLRPVVDSRTPAPIAWPDMQGDWPPLPTTDAS